MFNLVSRMTRSNVLAHFELIDGEFKCRQGNEVSFACSVMKSNTIFINN